MISSSDAEDSCAQFILFRMIANTVGKLRLKSKMMNGSLYPHRLKLLFLITLAISFSLWCYAVFTTNIEKIDISYLPMFHELPPTFFAGFGLLIIATLIWYCSPKIEAVHFLLLLFWLMFLFVGPELIEANARGSDTFSCLAGVTYLEAGKFHEYFYNAFPGFFYLSTFLYEITGIEYHDFAKILAISLHFIRLFIIIGFVRSLFKRHKDILFSALLFQSLLWTPLTYPGPAPFGLILFPCLLSLFFYCGISLLQRRGLLIILFTAVVISHGLTAFIILLILIFFILMSFTKKELGYSYDVTEYKLALLFGVIFTVWFLYSSNWVLEAAIQSFKDITLRNLLPTAVEHYATRLTQYRKFVLSLTYLFLCVLLAWIFAIIGRREFRVNFDWGRIFPLLCILVVSCLILTGAYSYEGLHRIYCFAVPFLVWFFARERESGNRLAVCLLVILLVLSFVLRYSSEYALLPPTTEFQGAQFVCEKMPSAYTIYYERWGPNFAWMVNTIRGPHTVTSNDLLGNAQVMESVHFATNSTLTKNFILYSFGKEYWDRIQRLLYKQRTNLIYSNGDFQLRAYLKG